MNKIQSISGILSLLLVHVSWAQDWPQWRGLHRDGRVQEFSVPAAWPDSLKLVWKIEAGAGLSSPVVADGKVYLITREGDDEIVSSYRLADGGRIWQQRYASPFVPNAQAMSTRHFPASRGKGPFATPIIHGNRLYTLGVDRVLSCFDKNTGALQWRHHYLKQEIPTKIVYECQPCGCSEDGKEFEQAGNCSACRMALGAKGLETSASLGDQGNYYGTAASPLIEGNIGIVNIGNLKGGDLIAFDLISGKEKWRWHGPAPSSSSPVMATLHGSRQVVVLTRDNLAGVDVKNGAGLWHYAIESNAQVVTPIVFEDLVIFSAYRSPTTAVHVKKDGSSWSAEKAWSTNEVTLYMSTPVLIGEKLYGLSYTNRGQFFAMEARSGKVLWASDGRQAQNAAILSIGDELLALTDEAELIAMAREGGAYQQLADYQVAGSPTWAHPVLWGNNILVKDETHLTLWRVD
ncbi:MAG: PQQ-binding-like beta-propeller repeat protein [bacterium]